MRWTTGGQEDSDMRSRAKADRQKEADRWAKQEQAASGHDKEDKKRRTREGGQEVLRTAGLQQEEAMRKRRPVAIQKSRNAPGVGGQ